MQDYDPEWSAVVVLDYFTDVSNAARILTICLEQIAENPPDLVPRLHWLIRVVKLDLDAVGENGAYHAKHVRDYLYQLEPGEDDKDGRPGESPQ